MKERGNCCLQRGLAGNRTPRLEEGLGFAVQGREEAGGENSDQRDLFSVNTSKGRGRSQPCPKGKDGELLPNFLNTLVTSRTTSCKLPIKHPQTRQY